MGDEWLRQIRDGAKNVGGAFYELFAHVLNGSDKSEELEETPDKQWVSFDDLAAYAVTASLNEKVARRVWRLLLTQINTVLSKPLELRGWQGGGTLPEWTAAKISVASLKRSLEELRPGLIRGYGPRMNDVLVGWIRSLP